MNYIYLNFNDLNEDKQEKLRAIARQNVKEETTQKEADDLNMDIDDLINEKIDGELINLSHQGKFVFNV